MNQQLLVQDRIRKIVAIAIVIFLLFGLRLIEIQAIRANGYVEKVDVELGKTATLLAPRGNIYDINGIELARSISAINIAVDQTVVNDPVAAANIVAPILGMTPSQLLPDITGERRYVLIAKDVTPAKWNAVYEGIEKVKNNIPEDYKLKPVLSYSSSKAINEDQIKSLIKIFYNFFFLTIFIICHSSK